MGVTYRPMLEWVLAGIWAHYTPDEFGELDGAMQSLVVAAYRTNMQIEAVVSYDANKKSNTKKG